MYRRLPIRFLLRLVPAALLYLGCLAPAAASAGAAPAGAAPALALAPCQLEQAQHLLSLPAECGSLTVPEDPAAAGGRQIHLFVARIPAISQRHAPDPLFLLAGGPGLGASDFYPNVAGAFARIHRDRDIVLVDQRGTGRSNPLDCGTDERTMWDASTLRIAAVMRDCQRQLAAHADLATYTTSVAVADLDAVRRALGYARINLYGSSYGTRVAQHYLRRHPDAVRAVILDGVVPPALVLGPATPLDAQRSLDQVLARCAADTTCHAQFGDPRGDYDALRAQLARQGVTLTLPDPRSGADVTLEFGAPAFATVLRLASYSADQAALLPLALRLAHRDGRFQPLAAQFLLATTTYGEALAYGMHNSVVCAEDVPFFAGKVDRAALGDTFLGTAQVDALAAICEVWPRGRMDADLHAPLDSAVPALLLSGGADPVTPAAYGTLAAQGFRHALHLVLPDQGHGQLLAPCMDRVMRDFLDAAGDPQRAVAIDHGCLAAVKPPPFFLGLGGPAP